MLDTLVKSELTCRAQAPWVAGRTASLAAGRNTASLGRIFRFLQRGSPVFSHPHCQGLTFVQRLHSTFHPARVLGGLPLKWGWLDGGQPSVNYPHSPRIPLPTRRSPRNFNFSNKFKFVLRKHTLQMFIIFTCHFLLITLHSSYWKFLATFFKLIFIGVQLIGEKFCYRNLTCIRDHYKFIFRCILRYDHGFIKI